MKNKLLFILFFTPFFISIVVLEVAYSLNKPDYRHRVDYIVKKQLPNLHNKNYSTILLGDSLAQKSFTALKIHDSILSLASNQAISLAGNYYILEKYLSTNQTPQNLYLFLIPKLLTNDLRNQYLYTYYQTVFNTDKQISEMELVQPGIFRNRNNNYIDKYMESRIYYFLNFQSYTPPVKKKHVSINKDLLTGDKVFKNKRITDRFKEMNKKLDQNISKIPEVYLDKIIKLCKINNIKFTIVIEPLPKSINKIFLTSKIYKHINSLDINIININDYYLFRNEYFYDGMHIRGNVNSYYQSLIDKNILDLYE